MGWKTRTEQRCEFLTQLCTKKVGGKRRWYQVISYSYENGLARKTSVV